jgi:hypothetical protein
MGTRATLRRLRTFVSLELGHRLIRPLPDDAYLAAAVRSGSTWLRTMLVNARNPEARSDPDVFNRELPSITIRNARLVRDAPRPRLIMTHGTWRPAIRRAVYLVRDGRDSVVSRYHYYVTRRGRDESFASFYRDYCAGAYDLPWHVGVESWLGTAREVLGPELHVVRFETLKHDTVAVLGGVCEFLGLGVTPADVARAVDEASLENERRIEARRDGAYADPDRSFYRGGRAGQWRELFSDEIRADFLRRSRRAMELAGYEA